MADPVYADAAFSAAGKGALGDQSLSDYVTQAMSNAIRNAIDDGVCLTNADELRKRQLEAANIARKEYLSK